MPFRTVGWIGLGAMGLPQAGNLLRKLDGLETLVVFDVDSTRASKLPSVEGRKIVNAKSQEDVVEACDAVFTMLPTPKLSLDVYAGFADKIRPGQFILECATVGPKVAKELAGIVEAAGATFIDTPVSGGWPWEASHAAQHSDELSRSRRARRRASDVDLYCGHGRLSVSRGTTKIGPARLAQVFYAASRRREGNAQLHGQKHFSCWSSRCRSGFQGRF